LTFNCVMLSPFSNVLTLLHSLRLGVCASCTQACDYLWWAKFTGSIRNGHHLNRSHIYTLWMGYSF